MSEMRAGKAGPLRVFAHLRVFRMKEMSGGEARSRGVEGSRSRTGPRPPSLTRLSRRTPCPGVPEAQAGGWEALWPRVVDLCGDYASAVQPLPETREVSLELTDAVRLLGPAKEIGREFRNRLRGELGLAVIVGIGPSATIAHLASRAARPGEVMEVTPEEAAEFVGRLPVAVLPGVEPDWARWLGEMGVHTAHQLAALLPEAVARTFGERGRRAWEIARGGDPAPAPGPASASEPAEERVTGQFELRPATEDRAQVRAALRVASEQVAQQLRRQGKAARQVRIEIIFHDLRHVELRRTLPCATWSPRALWAVTRTVFDRAHLGRRQVRRVRVKALRLVVGEHGGQLPLPLPEPPAARKPVAGPARRFQPARAVG